MVLPRNFSKSILADYIFIYKYFHGNNDAGIGASHQTGWTRLVARLIHLSTGLNAQHLLNLEHKPVLSKNLCRQLAAAAGRAQRYNLVWRVDEGATFSQLSLILLGP